VVIAISLPLVPLPAGILTEVTGEFQ